MVKTIQHSTSIITYYMCQEPECDDLVKEELMMLSDDLKHNGFAVNRFIEKAIEHLKGKDIPMKRIIIFSDNCSQQYKSCKVFKTLSNKRIPVLWNYFGASHGKGEADGVIGRLSMIIDAVVCSGTFEFSNCKELTAYCWQYLKMGDNSRGICCHYHRQYYKVSNIVHVEDTDDIHTIRGTLGFHLVRNTGTPGVIKVHASSCFCEPCFLDTPGECRYKRLVKKFLWASLYKVNSAKATKAVTIFENTLWNSTSDKHVPMKHPVAKHWTVMLNAPSKYPNSTT